MNSKQSGKVVETTVIKGRLEDCCEHKRNCFQEYKQYNEEIH